MTKESSTVHPLVLPLLESLTFEDDGRFFFPDEAAGAFAASVSEQEAAEKDEVALHLALLAIRFTRTAAELADAAVQQLCGLIFDMMGEADAAAVLERASRQQRAGSLIGASKTDYAALANRTSSSSSEGGVNVALLANRFRM